MFAEDLLEQARHLANRERRRPKQASLRRAVSTAYYALFHLLISEATRNWKHGGQRAVLARLFDHGKMKAASLHEAQTESRPAQLRQVAKAFVDLQKNRHDADYDNARVWTRSDTLDQVASAEAAFATWRAIRDRPEAQSYLLSLLGKRS